MDKPVEITLDQIVKIFNGEGSPVTVRYIYKWLGGTRLEFASGDTIFEKQPFGLRALSEEKMQQATILEVVNAPKHLKGHWRQVFDENKNVVVKYFPTPEEEEEQERIHAAYRESMDHIYE